MATNAELDPVFRQAIRLLHSPNNDAAESIRKALDDLIKQRHGPSKMLINTLSKKYLAEESLATGSGIHKQPQSARRSSHKSSDSSSNNSNSSPVQSNTATAVVTVASTVTAPVATVLTTNSTGQRQELPVILALPDSSSSNSGTENPTDSALVIDNQHLEDLEDLVCVVCRRIHTSAKNRLIECAKCNSLYHQECHVPQISDSELADDQESSWCCATCKTKVIKSTHDHLIASPAKSSSSHSSSSSSSSSSSHTGTRARSSAKSSSSSKKPSERTTTLSSSTQKPKSSSSSSSSSRHHQHHHHHKSHHHSSSKHERSSGSNGSSGGGNGSSSKTGITPNINIISADKRLQIMKKKAAKSHESKRKK